MEWCGRVVTVDAANSICKFRKGNPELNISNVRYDALNGLSL